MECDNQFFLSSLGQPALDFDAPKISVASSTGPDSISAPESRPSVDINPSTANQSPLQICPIDLRPTHRRLQLLPRVRHPLPETPSAARSPESVAPGRSFARTTPAQSRISPPPRDSASNHTELSYRSNRMRCRARHSPSPVPGCFEISIAAASPNRRTAEPPAPSPAYTPRTTVRSLAQLQHHADRRPLPRRLIQSRRLRIHHLEQLKFSVTLRCPAAMQRAKSLPNSRTRSRMCYSASTPPP